MDNEKDIKQEEQPQEDMTKKLQAENEQLKQELEKVKSERDLYKKERDEANATILNSEPKKQDKSDFDNAFGGIL